MHLLSTLSLIVLLLFGTQAAAAEPGFRCGRHLVHKGDTKDAVVHRCGTADDVRSWSEVQTESIWENGNAIERQIEIVYDEWKYDLGRNRLVRYLTFSNGRLSRVETSEYGN